MSTHLKFMTQKSSLTLQNINFHSQCVHAHLNRAIEMNVISRDTFRGDFILQGKYQCIKTKVVSTHELLTLLKSLQ